MSDFDLELNAFLFGMECKGISTQAEVKPEYKDTELEVIFLNGYNFE